jgi:hypothetical protein
MSADDVSEAEKNLVRVLLFFAPYHYERFPPTKGGMELEAIKIFTGSNNPRVGKILESLMKEGDITSNIDSGHIFYRLIMKGKELVKKLGKEKMEEYKNILRKNKFDPIEEISKLK